MPAVSWQPTRKVFTQHSAVSKRCCLNISIKGKQDWQGFLEGKVFILAAMRKLLKVNLTSYMNHEMSYITLETNSQTQLAEPSPLQPNAMEGSTNPGPRAR